MTPNRQFVSLSSHHLRDTTTRIHPDHAVTSRCYRQPVVATTHTPEAAGYARQGRGQKDYILAWDCMSIAHGNRCSITGTDGYWAGLRVAEAIRSVIGHQSLTQSCCAFSRGGDCCRGMYNWMYMGCIHVFTQHVINLVCPAAADRTEQASNCPLEELAFDFITFLFSVVSLVPARPGGGLFVSVWAGLSQVVFVLGPPQSATGHGAPLRSLFWLQKRSLTDLCYS